jgi:hypothetical protein
MSSLRSLLHSAYKSASEAVLPVRSQSAFKEKGVSAASPSYRSAFVTRQGRPGDFQGLPVGVYSSLAQADRRLGRCCLRRQPAPPVGWPPCAGAHPSRVCGGRGLPGEHMSHLELGGRRSQEIPFLPAAKQAVPDHAQRWVLWQPLLPVLAAFASLCLPLNCAGVWCWCMRVWVPCCLRLPAAPRSL